MKRECDEWIYSAKLLFTDLTSDRNAYPEINLVDLARTTPGISRLGQKSRMNENLNETELSTASTRTTRRQSVNVMPGQRLVASNESYEALAEDNNTKYKSLNVISVGSASSDNNKMAVFNAFKTIEKLQEQIVYASEA